MQVLW